MICRLCLMTLNEDNAILLFDASENETEMTKIIAKFLYLELTQNDEVSTTICQVCWRNLDNFRNFCEFVKEKQNNLHNTLEARCKVSGTDLPEELEESLIDNNDESMMDIKDEIIEGDIYAKHKSPGNEFAYASDDGEMLDNTTENYDDIPLTSLRNILKRTVIKKRRKRKTIYSTIKSQLKKKLIKPEEERITTLATIPNDENVDVQKEENAIENDDVLPKPKRYTSELSKKSDELISNYMRLKCEICEISIEKFSELRTHYKEKHNCKGYVHCCGKRFPKRILLVDHINFHLNPQYFQCKICQKTLRSRGCLEVHMENSHKNVENLKFECKVCGKKFPRNNNLKHHSLTHQTERDFNCKLCEKAFVTKYRLNLHIKAIHDNISPYVCDFCGRKFKFKPSFDQHVAEHQGIYETPQQCNICDEWFKHKNGLRLHIKRRHNVIDEELECEQCGRICRSKSALTSHIRYTHKKQRNLQCSFCEKYFKTKKTLDEHIATHTGERNNQCPHCPRDFRSKANMYVHIKRDHYEEWTNKKLASSKAPHANLLAAQLGND